ncbi:MAG: TonB-dependent siderophore receptor [Brevundimonas sp.]|uniref:TonB-dependent receptor n=1 Tax=Brevundimonas sp. TaxID=1871086 RepID=UPI0027271FD5|nr:TonB-dependent siderophore receptor [Brevundimonas sp.]MDO9609435.1 TonB-dependent siderophore receptor [Brevundimonas sp.]
MSESRAAALRSLLFASSAAGMLVAAPALAADVTPEGGVIVTADQQQQPANLGTIDVNGQVKKRQPESPEFVAPLLDTPRSVTIIPEQVITQTAATSLEDLLRNSPGITFGAGEGGQPLADRPFIRGQSSGNNIFVDGVRDAGGQQREVFDLEQVEVIKGADSVYSGRGSGGGSINLSSKQPRLTDVVNASAGVGTDNYYRATVDGNWRLNDTSAFRLNLMATEGDVPGRDAVDFEKYGMAMALGLGLGTDTSATVSYYHLTSDSMPDYGIPLDRKLDSTWAIQTTDSRILNVPYDTFYGLKARDYMRNEVDSVSVKLEHKFSDTLTLRNLTRYSETLNDYVVTNPGDGGTAVLVGDTWWMKRGTKSRWNPAETFANVTDLFGTFQTGALKHSFDLGVEYSRERNRNASYTVTTTSGTACPTGLTGFDCTPVYDPNPNDPWTGSIVRGAVTSNTTKSTGVYAADSISFGSKWVLNLGLRWDDYAVRGLSSAGVAVPENSWDFVNYQIGLVYKPTANTSIYASYATSSTPPTVSAGDQNSSGGNGSGNLESEILDPEDTENYEIGAKAELFGQRLTLSGALFQTTRKNAQILVEDGVYEQAGETEVKGLELGFSGNVTPLWTVFGGYTYMDSELVSGAYNNVNVGDPLANTPKNSFSLFTTYRVMPKLSLGGGVYYVGDRFGGNQGGAGGGTGAVYAPSYTRLDLFASYDVTDRASLQLNVKNATDEEYIMRTNGVHHADPAPARQAILTLNLRF